ncbi:hypothetical protein M9458_037484, partial [Cirrhinus mrigala]
FTTKLPGRGVPPTRHMFMPPLLPFSPLLMVLKKEVIASFPLSKRRSLYISALYQPRIKCPCSPPIYSVAGQAGSALYTMPCKVLQDKLLHTIDESGRSSNAFKELSTATDLALHATKAAAQSIGRAMTNLVVLGCHIWLHLKKIKDTDKISPKGLFGP